MKYIKTYGVRGILEWQAVIHCGRLNMRVPFTGGSLTAFGVNPATFTTENAFTQSAIEGSEYYKLGKIILVRCIEKEEAKTEADGDTAPASAESAEVKSVKVSDAQEAKEYLMDNFGVKATALRSLAAIKATAEANGIVFEGI